MPHVPSPLVQGAQIFVKIDKREGQSIFTVLKGSLEEWNNFLRGVRTEIPWGDRDDPPYVQEIKKLISKKGADRLLLFGVTRIDELTPSFSKKSLEVLLSKKDYRGIVEYLTIWNINLLGED